MNVSYEIRETEHYGKGLFVLESITKGTRIWSYKLNENVVEYDEQESLSYLQSLPSLKAQQRFLDSSFGRGGVLCLINDDGQYVNHAEAPNCKTDLSTGHCYAIQDIAAGDQIFEDYTSFTHPPFLFPLLKKYECKPDYYALPSEINEQI
jgi:SET domain-containing protein